MEWWSIIFDKERNLNILLFKITKEIFSFVQHSFYSFKSRSIVCGIEMELRKLNYILLTITTSSVRKIPMNLKMFERRSVEIWWWKIETIIMYLCGCRSILHFICFWNVRHKMKIEWKTKNANIRGFLTTSVFFCSRQVILCKEREIFKIIHVMDESL